MAAQPSGVSATPPSFVSSANLLQVHSIPSSLSLMSKLNKTGPSTDPWGTPLVTSLQLDSAPLMTTPLSSALQPVLKPPHWPLIQPTFPELPYEDVMGDSVKSLAVVKVDNIQCSPLIYPASPAITEGYQIGQARFPLGESMLTTDFLFFFFPLEEQSPHKHHL